MKYQKARCKINVCEFVGWVCDVLVSLDSLHVMFNCVFFINTCCIYSPQGGDFIKFDTEPGQLQYHTDEVQYLAPVSAAKNVTINGYSLVQSMFSNLSS